MSAGSHSISSYEFPSNVTVAPATTDEILNISFFSSFTLLIVLFSITIVLSACNAPNLKALSTVPLIVFPVTSTFAFTVPFTCTALYAEFVNVLFLTCTVPLLVPDIYIGEYFPVAPVWSKEHSSTNRFEIVKFSPTVMFAAFTKSQFLTVNPLTSVPQYIPALPEAVPSNFIFSKLILLNDDDVPKSNSSIVTSPSPIIVKSFLALAVLTIVNVP